MGNLFCVACDKPLEGRQKRYCSYECKQVANKTKPRVAFCRYCKQEFTTEVPSKKYCSDTCRRRRELSKRESKAKKEESVDPYYLVRHTDLPKPTEGKK